MTSFKRTRKEQPKSQGRRKIDGASVLMLKSWGKLVVHPRDRSTWPQPLWVVVHIEDDLGDYLLALTKQEVKAWYQLQKPAWKHHISAVRGEIDAIPGQNFSFDGEEVEFFYDMDIYQAGGHFCVNARCQRITEIRTSLGLQPDPPIQLHLTFGVVVQPSPHYNFWTKKRVSAVIPS